MDEYMPAERLEARLFGFGWHDMTWHDDNGTTTDNSSTQKSEAITSTDGTRRPQTAKVTQIMSQHTTPGARHQSLQRRKNTTTTVTSKKFELLAAVDGTAGRQALLELYHSKIPPFFTCCRCKRRWAPLGLGFSRCRSRTASARVSAVMQKQQYHKVEGREGTAGTPRGAGNRAVHPRRAPSDSNGYAGPDTHVADPCHGGRAGRGRCCQRARNPETTLKTLSATTTHLWIEQQILRLDIAMADAEGVDVSEGPGELVEVELDEEHRQRLLALVVRPRHAVHGFRHELQHQVKVQFVRLG